MVEKLEAFLESLKAKQHPTHIESATKQAIILPLITLLGWDTTNIDEVSPEYSVENGRVDYSLRIKKENRVFIEVKKLGDELEKYQEQLLEYSFREGVEIAILTNGITWWWYLPTKKGDWKARKFYTIDIDQQDSRDVAQKFVDLLLKDNVSTGKAYDNADSIYKGKLKKKVLEET
ncbi:MAG TPA: type I restriction endonuclease, partial [Candidatus Hypogeohydataceae bacterium YC41]